MTPPRPHCVETDRDTPTRRILQIAARQPSAPALWTPQGDAISYGELARAVQRCLEGFRAQGLGPGDPVALTLPNGVDFVTAALALWRVGAVLVPLNPRLSEAEIAVILQDAQIHWRIGPQAGGALCPVTPLAQEETPLASSERDFPADLAALVYTSGTTGRPKGVMLSHENLLADAQANIAVLQADSNDRFLALPPLAHVYGLVNALLSALMVGASTAFVDGFRPQRVASALEQLSISTLIAVPTMYQAMVAYLGRSTPIPQRFSSLRVCHSGAAAMPPSLIADIERYFGAPVQEGYGLSEATSIVCSNPLAGPRKAGFVGPPVAGVALRVADAEGVVTQPGAIGELQVKGPTVMRGYYRRPRETAAAFTPDGWLKTGDLALRDADGYAAIVARQDDLIVVGGLKTYPREIEEALLLHPDVAEAAVAGVASQVAGGSSLTHQRIHAWIRPRPGAAPSVGELAGACAQRLASYKIPTRWHFTPDPLPQGPSGKILRKTLREQALAQDSTPDTP
ncbi:MAG: AMP-binding protein [Vampirovibrionales bacterium]|nr:AMP-binding protein [Vampirovibrionales bacterium]